MIISIINQKGGVGKTTTAVNLGAALAEGNRRVLLVDLDPQSSLSQFRHLKGSLSLETATAKSLAALLRQSKFDYAILDCPPALGPESAASLKAAHLALVPLQAEFAAWIGLANLLQTVAVARDRANPTLDLKIALTMWDARSRHCREVEAATRAGQGERVLSTVIRRSVVFADASAAGESVLTYAPRSAAASLYRKLAEEVVSLCPVAQT